MKGMIKVVRPPFTTTEEKLLAALADGKPHKVEELMALIDSQCTLNNLRYHMSNLRTKVRRAGEATVVYEDGAYRKLPYPKLD